MFLTTDIKKKRRPKIFIIFSPSHLLYPIIKVTFTDDYDMSSFLISKSIIITISVTIDDFTIYLSSLIIKQLSLVLKAILLYRRGTRINKTYCHFKINRLLFNIILLYFSIYNVKKNLKFIFYATI